jgi:hypothetical protein
MMIKEAQAAFAPYHLCRIAGQYLPPKREKPYPARAYMKAGINNAFSWNAAPNCPCKI